MESTRYFIVSTSCLFVGGACLNPFLTTSAIIESPDDSLDPPPAAICRNGAKAWLRRGRRRTTWCERGETVPCREGGEHEGERKGSLRGAARRGRRAFSLPACWLASRDNQPATPKCLWVQTESKLGPAHSLT